MQQLHGKVKQQQPHQLTELTSESTITSVEMHQINEPVSQPQQSNETMPPDSSKTSVDDKVRRKRQTNEERRLKNVKSGRLWRQNKKQRDLELKTEIIHLKEENKRLNQKFNDLLDILNKK